VYEKGNGEGEGEDGRWKIEMSEGICRKMGMCESVSQGGDVSVGEWLLAGKTWM
jgi:hypothetical protein